MNNILDGDSTVVVAKDQVSCDLGGEAVILHLTSGIYYGLVAVGARIWELLQKPRTLNEIRDVLVTEYEVEPDRCEQDLRALFQEMSAQGLIQIEREATR